MAWGHVCCDSFFLTTETSREQSFTENKKLSSSDLFSSETRDAGSRPEFSFRWHFFAIKQRSNKADTNAITFEKLPLSLIVHAVAILIIFTNDKVALPISEIVVVVSRSCTFLLCIGDIVL